MIYRLSLVLVLLLLLSLPTKSQVTWQTLDSLTINSEILDSVSQYYKNIQKAENYIIRGKFDNAAEKYQKAFTFIDYPFLRDLSNAIKCEVLSSGEKNTVLNYIWLKVRKTGITDDIKSDTSLLNLPYWKDIEILLDTTIPVYDTALHNYLNFIKELDQDIRLQSKKKYGTTYNEFTNDTINAIDSINYFRIIKIIEESGHLTEELTGNQWSVINLILRHNLERPELFILLYESVLAGKLSAINYTNILASSKFRVNNINTLSNNIWQLNKYTYVAKYLSKKEKTLFNKYRSKLLIEDIDTYHKKILWQFKQENTEFKFYNTTNEIMADEDYYQTLLSKKIRGKKVKIYYKTPEIKKQLLKEAKEWKKEQKNLKKDIAE